MGGGTVLLLSSCTTGFIHKFDYHSFKCINITVESSKNYFKKFVMKILKNNALYCKYVNFSSNNNSSNNERWTILFKKFRGLKVKMI